MSNIITTMFRMYEFVISLTIKIKKRHNINKIANDGLFLGLVKIKVDKAKKYPKVSERPDI